MKTSLDHLPEEKRLKFQAIAALLQAEPAVEMVILFGSYARGDWVEDPDNGYYSDFDLLVVTGTEAQARDLSTWTDLSRQAQHVAGRAPVNLIVHDIKEINQEIRLGQYFFIDILREGVLLYTARRHSLASPKALAPADRLRLGLVNFRYWFGSAGDFWRSAGHAAARNLGPQAAFLLHQAVERYYNAAALVFTGYKEKTHNIEVQADKAAAFHPALSAALPRAEPEDERLFDLLKRGYIEARYSKSYKITLEELNLLRDRVLDLAARVHLACAEKLATFCGPEAVGPLPEPPAVTDLGALPEAPAFDDAAAFRAWREALTALSFERGLETGQKQGFDRGKEAGLSEGQKQGFDRGKGAGLAEALLTILSARGTPPDAETRAKIEACTDPAELHRWIAQATTGN